MPRRLSKEEAVALSQGLVEKLFPVMRETAEEHGLSECQALTGMGNALMAMHQAVHEREAEKRAAAPYN
jgi:hypothetical protein